MSRDGLDVPRRSAMFQRVPAHAKMKNEARKNMTYLLMSQEVTEVGANR